MKRYSSALLALLLTLSLAGCGSVIQNQGSHSASLDAYYFRPEASNDQIWAVVPDGSTPDGSQTPSNDGILDNGGSSASAGQTEGNRPADKGEGQENKTLDENGWYSSKEEVALYIHLYGELPDNYVTKSEAEDAGWSGGNVERYTGDGTAIGGSRFGNREGLLPKEPGRVYTECDIDTVGENSRGAKRIVFSNDGLIYYTDDHYENFELLYGAP